MGFLASIINAPARLIPQSRPAGVRVSRQLVESAHADSSAILDQLDTRPNGLTSEEAEARLERFGPNQVARERRITIFERLWDNVKNPLVILLLILGFVSLPHRRPARHHCHRRDGPVRNCAALLPGTARR